MLSITSIDYNSIKVRALHLAVYEYQSDWVWDTMYEKEWITLFIFGGRICCEGWICWFWVERIQILSKIFCRFSNNCSICSQIEFYLYRWNIYSPLWYKMMVSWCQEVIQIKRKLDVYTYLFITLLAFAIMTNFWSFDF